MRHEDTTVIENFFPRSSSENTRKMFNHGKFRVVVGTQNHLGTNLCVQGEDTMRHKTEDIFLINNGPT